MKKLILISFITLFHSHASTHVEIDRLRDEQINKIVTEQKEWHKENYANHFSVNQPDIFSRNHLVKKCRNEKALMASSLSLNLEQNLANFTESVESFVDSSRNALKSEVNRFFARIMYFTSEAYLFNTLLNLSGVVISKSICISQKYAGVGVYGLMAKGLMASAATGIGTFDRDKVTKTQTQETEEMNVILGVGPGLLVTTPVIVLPTGGIIKGSAIDIEKFNKAVKAGHIKAAMDAASDSIMDMCVNYYEDKTSDIIKSVLTFLTQSYEFDIRAIEMCMNEKSDPLAKIKLQNTKLSELRDSRLTNIMTQVFFETIRIFVFGHIKGGASRIC
jgi:hypothetical protein